MVESCVGVYPCFVVCLGRIVCVFCVVVSGYWRVIYVGSLCCGVFCWWMLVSSIWLRVVLVCIHVSLFVWVGLFVYFVWW